MDQLLLHSKYEILIEKAVHTVKESNIKQIKK